MKESWQKRLEKDRDFYKNLCDKLNLQLTEQGKRLALLDKLVLGPPTLMIACEKIVEAAAQLTCSANTLIKESKDAKR